MLISPATLMLPAVSVSLISALSATNNFATSESIVNCEASIMPLTSIRSTSS